MAGVVPREAGFLHRFGVTADLFVGFEHQVVPVVERGGGGEAGDAGADDESADGVHWGTGERKRGKGEGERERGYMRSGASMPSRSKPRAITFAVRSQMARRERRSSSVGALRTGHAS